jgi:5-formyltetrahydrofolate cyclo-ligase
MREELFSLPDSISIVSAASMNKEQRRRDIARQRNHLSPESISTASLAVTQSLWRLPSVTNAKRIGAYFSVGGEIDCQFAVDAAWKRGKNVYLPVLRGQELVYAPYFSNSSFLRNRYGIPEPITPKSQFLSPEQMDVVFTPLISFDGQGNRLGQGGGYYDRSFRFLKNRNRWRHPKLIGLAYEFQKSPKLKAFSWDVPLDDVVTELKTYSFRKNI